MATSYVTVPQLRDAIDSFYEWVKARVQVYNPERSFGGIAQARDWPMQNADLNTPYLLVVSETPTSYAKTVSQYQPNMIYKVQWVWMVQGDNIPANSQANNRGNKFGLNMQMIQEMLVGHYPGYCPKQQISVVDDGTGKPISEVLSYNPPEFVRWALPHFVDKLDKSTGILFCSGAVNLAAFAPAITQ